MGSSKEYMRQYMRQYSTKRRETIIQLLGGKCRKCGSTEQLEVDHKDPENKSFTLGNGWHHKRVTNLKELKKCQLLCKNCHIEKTVLERGQKLARGTHGTLSSYRYCKCELCRKANSNYYKQYKRTHNSAVRVLPS